MDFKTYAQSKYTDYVALAETVAAVLRVAIAASAGTLLRLQQVRPRLSSQKARAPRHPRDHVARRRHQGFGRLPTDFLHHADATGFLRSGIIHDNFEVDWDRTKIHHPVPGQIAAEQRRAEESLEMGKRTYDDPGDGSETEL